MATVINELIPYLNTALLIALVAYVVRVEHRLTMLEGLPRRVEVLERATFRGLRQSQPGDS